VDSRRVTRQRWLILVIQLGKARTLQEQAPA